MRGQGPMGYRTGVQDHMGQMQGGPAHRSPAMQQANKRSRFFVALFDYNPSTMSPNPEVCEEELPFSEGDIIKVRLCF